MFIFHIIFSDGIDEKDGKGIGHTCQGLDLGIRMDCHFGHLLHHLSSSSYAKLILLQCRDLEGN
jgi:hypothetical protein